MVLIDIVTVFDCDVLILMIVAIIHGSRAFGGALHMPKSLKRVFPSTVMRMARSLASSYGSRTNDSMNEPSAVSFHGHAAESRPVVS